MSSPASAGSGEHIVDVLIAERAPRLAASPAWPLARPLLYRLLNYRRARRMADAIAPLPGIEALEHVSRLLEVKVKVSGLERIPSSGRLVIVSNHPTGIADGIAAWDTLRDRRPDLCFYANADAHRVVPGFSDVLIPVEWVAAKRTREHTRTTLHMTRQAMEAGRALAIFPAGRLARRTPDGRLCDPPWMSSAVSIARRHEAPVAPVHMTGPWSTLFHAFDRISKELRDITLFHELLNKRGGRFTLTVGPLVCPDRLGGDAEAATLALKTYVEQILPDDPDRPF